MRFFSSKSRVHEAVRPCGGRVNIGPTNSRGRGLAMVNIGQVVVFGRVNKSKKKYPPSCRLANWQEADETLTRLCIIHYNRRNTTCLKWSKRSCYIIQARGGGGGGHSMHI